MIHFEREVLDLALIDEMLKYFQIAHIGMHDEDGFPYVVPVNYGYEIKDGKLFVYIHCAKRGHKVELMKKNAKVCVEMSLFHDFPDCKYKGHYHDYRSVIAKGEIRLIEAQEDYETFERGYNLLYTCNHRAIKPLSERPQLPPIYIGVIECDLKNVTAKSEFPIRSVDDVPFMDVRSMPHDEKPFDISDIIADRRKKIEKM